MIARKHRLGASAIAALFGGFLMTAGAADPPPPRPCRELTGVERTKCEQQAREQNPPRADAPPPAADEKDPPPPDTKSESDEQSDTADPPQA